MDSLSTSLDNPKHIVNVCNMMKLPTQIAESYGKLGVETLYDWQYDCIKQAGVLTNENIVYCAPTSGGKTLISELMILRSAVSYKKRAIFILPFITLVLEKANHFKKILRGYIRSLGREGKFNVKAYHSDSNVNQIQVSDLIVVCTIEKANQLINTLIARGAGSGIGCLIVDEMHTLGDSFNGYLLEILVSKLKYLEIKSRDRYLKFQAARQDDKQGSQHVRAPDTVGIQLGAMSATVGNINALAAWFQAKLFVSTFRPMPLRECVVVGENVLDVKGEVLRRLPLPQMPQSNSSQLEMMNRIIMRLCVEGLESGQQILIFCPTKQLCQQMSDMLLKRLAPFSRGPFTHASVDLPVDALLLRRQLCSQKLSNSEDDLLAKATTGDAPSSSVAAQLQTLVQSGLGFHHSGLNSTQRVLIENAFRLGEISVLAATSTLAAGVNLPAGRVIIRSLAIGRDDLSVTNYKQMTGRAGRAGQCVNGYGESFLIATRAEMAKALQLVNQPLPDVNSQMNPRLDGGRGLMKAILEMHSLDICQSLSDTLEYVKGTLLFKESSVSSSSSDASSSFSKDLLDTVLGAINFLLLANALDFLPSSTPPPTQQSVKSTTQQSKPITINDAKTTSSTGSSSATFQYLTADNLEIHRETKLSITRFGRAIVQSSLNPDEAIIVYKDLLRAQDGINLETNLHLIYLLSPVDNSFTPDFTKLRSWYEKGKQECKLRDPRDIFVGDSMGLEESYGLINNWTHQPPSRDAINSCVEKLRNLSLRTWGDQSAAKEKLYFESLVRCKRVWVALVATELLHGVKPLNTLAADLHIPPSELENLRRSINMMASRVQRFCAEVGWSALERLINSFKSTVLNDDLTADSRELMQLEGVTQKLAETLVSRGLKTASDLLAHSSDELAAFLQLQRGFSVSQSSSIATSSVPKKVPALANATKENGEMSADLTFEEISKDEKVFRSLKALMEIVLNSARKFIQAQKEEAQKKAIEVISLNSQEETKCSNLDGNPTTIDLATLTTAENDDGEVNDEDEDDEDDDNEDDNDSTDSGYWSSEDALDQALARKEVRREESSMTFNRVLQSPVKSDPQAKLSLTAVTSATKSLPANRSQPRLKPQQESQQESQASALSLFDQVMGRASSNRPTSFQYEVHTEPSYNTVSNSAALKAIAEAESEVLSTAPSREIEPVNNATNITAASNISARSASLSLWAVQEMTDFAYEIDDYDDYGDEYREPTPPSKMRRLDPIKEATDHADSNLSASERLLDLKILSANGKGTQDSDQVLKRKVDGSLNQPEVGDPEAGIAAGNKQSKVEPASTPEVGSQSEDHEDEPKAPPAAVTVYKSTNAKSAMPRRRRETPSPYLTPFTASKLVDTPDHYLYLPQTQVAPRSPHAPTRRESRMSTSSEPDESETTNLPTFAIDVCSNTTVPAAFGYRHLSKTGNCRIFLQKLLHCRCISFELAFRRIPKASLPQRWKWGSRISWFCGQDCTADRGGVCSTSSLIIPETTSNTGMGDPHVLTGVSFNFGDEYGYYLPLPCSLPVSFDTADASLTKSTIIDRSKPLTLQSLPTKCHRLICRFVGFASILNRSPYLRSRTRGHEGSPIGVPLTRNPLLEVNKYWVRVARQALTIEWRKGQCVEWRLLNEIMCNPGITKVAFDMQSKLVALRERDVLVTGPLEDPRIAVSLLVNSTGFYEAKAAAENFLTSLAYPSHAHYESVAGGNKSPVDPSQSRTCRLACYRATATMRAMHTLTSTLINNSSLELFRNIEMPLLITTADMLFHGMAINSSYFSNLKSDVDDRMQVIEFYFKSTEGSEFSLSSYKDKAKLRDKYLSSYRDILNQKLKEMKMFDFDENNEKFLFYMKCLEDAQKRLEKHPLILLEREYNFFVRVILPFCGEVMSSRRFISRIRADISTIGSETGRLIITNPALQHTPKKVFYCHPVDRPTLHDELLSFARQQNVMVAVVCEQVNQSIQNGEKTYDVRVSLRTGAGTKIGRVRRISERFISELPDEDDSVVPLESGATKSDARIAVVDEWCQAGHKYTEDEATRIRQVMVQFPDSPTKLYAYPANKVWRVDAPIVSNTDELEIITKALLEGIWNCNKTLSIGDSCSLLSESAVKARRNSIRESISEDSSISMHNLRNGFVASEGYVLLSADYCQMELRLLAHFSEDPNLCRAFEGNQDVFRVLAARWKNKGPADITTAERDIIKQLCYANIYGSGARSIAEQANIEVEEASRMMKDFMDSYPGIPTFKASVKESCIEKGYITTLLGRRRTIPLIRSENRSEQAKGHRQAVNSMCQGSAADLIKLAMVNISYRLSLLTSADSALKQPSPPLSPAALQTETDSNEPFTNTSYEAPTGVRYRKSRQFPGGGLYSAMDEVRLVLQVHDELVYEVRKDLLPAVCRVVKECMEGAVSLRVPLQVKLSSGPSWGKLAVLSADAFDESARQPVARAIFGKNND